MGGLSGLGSKYKKSTLPPHPIKRDAVKPDQPGGYEIVYTYFQTGRLERSRRRKRPTVDFHWRPFLLHCLRDNNRLWGSNS